MPHFKIANRFKFVASKLTVLCGFSLGLVTFACGFFLNRSELPYVSTRLSDVTYVPAYRRLVVLLVDGLAFNFVRRDSDIYSTDLPGNLRFTSELLRSTKAHLVHFVADPPTTTLQRLKGLMTGSMPTFVDAGSNFQSYELMEDNLIRQWRQANRRILFVGDDTWIGLFPRSFDEADPYPSLNVKDLDTVDKAVHEFMTSALQNSSHGPHWDVLIGHLLGIDHCGHTYGPGHVEMRRKLRELDEFIRKLVTLLHPDDLLLVLGDHGMTVSGDHGGDSYAELDAALLLYSGRGFSQFINNTISRKSSIAQIDLVPTLAALTGVPVPYSNLGVCVDDFLGSSSEVRRALLLNFVQVLNYTLSYHREIGSIPMESDLEQFVDSLSHVADADLFTFAQRFENEQLRYRLQQLQAAFRKHWTRFDIGRMWIGLWLMLSGISTLLHFDSRWGKKELLITGQNFVAICTLFDIGTSFTTSVFGRLMFASVSIFVLCNSLLEYSVSFRSHVPLLLACLHGVSYLSNSFLVHEIRVTCFLLHTLILFYAFKRILTIETLFSNWHACCIPVALMFGIRLSVVFEVCREESFSTSNCRSAVDAWLAKPLTKLTLEEARLNGTFRLFVAFGALLLVIVSHQLWLKHLTKGTVRCVFLQYILPLAGFFLAVCWILDLAQVFVIQSSNNSLHWIRTCFSRALLLSITVVFARLSWSPLLIESIENSKVMDPNVPKQHSPHRTLSEVNTTSEFHSYVKPINTLAGMASVYSSWTGTTLILLPLLASLIFLNEVHIFPLIAIPVTFALLSYFLQDFAVQANDDEDNLLARHLSQASSWQIAIASSLLDNLSFYITGHQATIVGIPWDAAYAAYSGIHATHWLPALMVIVHLYAGSILVASSLSLFVILVTPKNGLWTRTDRCCCSTEFALCTIDPKSVQFDYAFDRLAWRFFACKAILTFGSVVSAFLLRRHLMVWKIFAPRLLFSSLSLLVSGSVLIFVRVLVVNLLHSSVVDLRKRLLEKTAPMY